MTSAYGDDERLSSSPLIRAASPPPIAGRTLATLNTDNGDGSYAWTRYVPSSGSQPAGVRQGTAAWELTLKTGLALPRNVVIFFDAGRWWFDSGSSSSGGGGGSPGWYGNGIDGSVTVAAATAAIQSAGSGAWASDPNYPLIVSAKGTDLAAYISGGVAPTPPGFDSTKTYAVLLRDGYFSNLSLASNVVLIPSRSLVCCTGTLSGPVTGTGAGAFIDNSGNMDDAGNGLSGGFAFGGIASIVLNYTSSLGYIPNYPSAYRQTIGAQPHFWEPGGAGAISAPGGAGTVGTANTAPPFDESSSGLNSGAGGAGTGFAGGLGSGAGSPRGHPLNTLPGSMVNDSFGGGVGPFPGTFTGGSGGGGGGAGALVGGIGTAGAPGGSGGAPIVLRCKTISAGSGLTVQSNGSNGWPGVSTGGRHGAGGGGGANPGYISVFSDGLDPAVTFSVQPGTGGAGEGGGAAGSNGNAVGYVYRSSSTAPTTVGTS